MELVVRRPAIQKPAALGGLGGHRIDRLFRTVPLSAGEKLGPYEVLARIGAGGMGDVWKACDSRLNRVVALKVSKVAFSERFEREARLIAALNHPHICTLYDVGPNYLVMELVEGKPLAGPMSAKQVTGPQQVHGVAVMPTAYIRSGHLLPLTSDCSEPEFFHILRTGDMV